MNHQEQNSELDIHATINQLVSNGMQALDQFYLLDQKQIDYIVAKASVQALDHHGELAMHAVKETTASIYAAYVA